MCVCVCVCVQFSTGYFQAYLPESRVPVRSFAQREARGPAAVAHGDQAADGPLPALLGGHVEHRLHLSTTRQPEGGNTVRVPSTRSPPYFPQLHDLLNQRSSMFPCSNTPD